MYTPKYARNDNVDELKEFIRAHGFGILFTGAGGKPWATHIPMVLSRDGSRLSGHISRANLQWKSFQTGEEVLAVFSGPHAYISSSWYDHENVPTWNYVAVHVSGTIRIIEGEAVFTHLKELTHQYEVHSTNPVSVEKMTPKFLETEMRGLVAFEIEISEITGARKLSQNRDDKNHTTIIENLENRTDEDSHKIAWEMKKNRPQKDGN